MYRFSSDDGLDVARAHLGTNDCRPHKADRARLIVKRLIDVFGAATFLIAGLPLLLSVVAGVLITSGWPFIYSHRRVGINGGTFNVYKFRSMRRDSEQALTAFLETNPEARDEWVRFRKLSNDPRVTRFGRFIRRTSLDELPQFWNVLRGDMSLVGPRPVTLSERAKYGECWRYYISVKPGISGLWQVNGRNELSYEERVAYDVEYAKKWSTRLDLRILIQTALVVISMKGSR